MNEYIKRLKKEFCENTDLIIKKIKINSLSNIYIVFLETLCSQDRINDYILKRLTSTDKRLDIQSKIPGSNLKKLDNYDQIEFYLYNGYTIIINNTKLFAVETKADLTRSISTNETEPSIKGPKNAFVENYQTNLGLIKRRIRSHHLRTKTYNIGRISNTIVSILYIDNIAKNETIKYAINCISNIDIDLINSIEEFNKYLEGNTIFPTTIITERPDRCAEALCEGKVILICDESPFAIIIPAFLTDFINPFSDRYNKNTNINLTKIIRFFCFYSSILVPSIYISIMNYNEETIPTSLILNFAMQRDAVPFPTIIECIVMLIICEILRESDLRFPSQYGSAISILGALIIGDAAVNAGLVSPIMIIITAFTYVSSLIFTELELNNAIRTTRFIFLIVSACYGLYGLMIAFMFFIIHLCDVKSAGYYYTFPISPFDKSYFSEFLFKIKHRFRSKMLTNNITKEN